MKKLLLSIFLILSFTLFAESRVSITAKSGKLVAEINLEESEYIIYNEDFLYLLIESQHYDLIFSGYPEGEANEYGDILYEGKVRLEGDLLLKEGVEPGDYKINVIVGFQTCDKSGVCNIPAEVAEEVLISSGEVGFSFILITAVIAVLVCFAGVIFYRRRRKL